MPTPMRRRLRMARRGFGYVVALVLVLIALLLGAASQVLPLAERHPDRIAAWLSERAGRPVAFDRVETQWTRRGPLLKLDGLRIGEGNGAFTVGDTEMLVSVYAGLLPGQAFPSCACGDWTSPWSAPTTVAGRSAACPGSRSPAPIRSRRWRAWASCR